jgi:NitT/TauT family transport system substrate-binding protein
MRVQRNGRRGLITWLAAMFALALLAAGCGGAAEEAAQEAEPAPPPEAAEDVTEEEPASGATDEAASGDLRQVTFALTNQRAIQYHPYYLADYLGYYEDEGFDVNIEIVRGSQAAVQQLIAGNVEIAHPSGPATAQAVSEGQCLRQIYSYEHINVFGLAGVAEQGIQELADLQDQTVGISEPSGGEVPLIRAILAEADLEENTDYTFLPIGEGGAQTVNALQQGDAQAYSSSVYDVAAVEAAGVELTTIMPDKFRYMPSTSIVVTCDTFESDKEMLTGFARAVAKATTFSQANQDAAYAITETYEPTLFEDETIAQAFWEAANASLQQPPDNEGKPWGSHHYEGWETYLETATQGTEEEGALEPEAVDTVLEETLTEELIPEINNYDEQAVIEEAENFQGV